MIDGVRRRLGKAGAREPWAADEELKLEAGKDTEPRRDTAVAEAANQASGRYTPNDSGTPDYYKSLVQTAIENGGRHGYHSISISWLRMILAGLELKRIEPEMMWYGIETGKTGEGPMPEVPPFEDFFRS